MPITEHESPESKWEVPAILQDQEEKRSFREEFPWALYPFREELQVYNRSDVVTLKIKLDNGDVRKIGPSDILSIEGKEIRWYKVTALDADLAEGEVDIYENGGLSTRTSGD